MNSAQFVRFGLHAGLDERENGRGGSTRFADWRPTGCLPGAGVYAAALEFSCVLFVAALGIVVHDVSLFMVRWSEAFSTPVG